MTPTRGAARTALAALAVFGVVALTGCTALAEDPGPTATPTVSIAVTPTPTEPAEPALRPEGTAAENLEFFTLVVEEVWAAGGESAVAGRTYIDALTAAGFDKSAMQVTEDTSTVGNPAESIQFSVAWGEECLVGQVGPATGDPFTVVVDALPDGGCLVGATRPIDW